MDPLPHRGPINIAQLDVNLLTACPKPWTSSDNNFENKASDMSKRIGILAKSRTVPMENDHKFDLSPEKNKTKKDRCSKAGASSVWVSWVLEIFKK